MDSARFAQIEETWQALRRIRDGRLYREKYTTFEEYVEKSGVPICSHFWQSGRLTSASATDGNQSDDKNVETTIKPRRHVSLLKRDTLNAIRGKRLVNRGRRSDLASIRHLGLNQKSFACVQGIDY
jgi:hypothetical protein